MSNDKIGYKQPPKNTQFKKGQSGNPKGRPKGSRNISKIVAEELNARIPVKENGKVKRISKSMAIIKRLATKALEGDYKATQMLFALTQTEEAKQEARREAPTHESLAKEDMALLAEHGFLPPKEGEE